MENRLKDIPTAKLQPTGNDRLDLEAGSPANVSDIELLEKDEAEGPAVSLYYVECNEIKDLINIMRKSVSGLKEKQSDQLVATTQKQLKKVKNEIGKIVKDTRETVKSIKDKLQDMRKTTIELKENTGYTATVRIREHQHAQLVTEFLEVLKDYHSVQEQYQKASEDRIKQQMKIVDPTISDEKIEQLMEKSGEDLQVFKDNLTSSQRSTLAAVYEEAAETNKDIRELQAQFYELHELFVDFYTILKEQSPLIDTIAENVNKSVEYVDKGNKNMKTANKYQKKSRKVMIIIFAVIIIVGVVVFLALLLVLGGGGLAGLLTNI